MNCTRLSSTMRHFSKILADLNLRDLPLMCRLGISISIKAGPFLVSEEWEDRFLGLTQSVLPKPIFYHSPLVLKDGRLMRGESPFRYKNMWLKIWWSRDNVSDPFNYILAMQLRPLNKTKNCWTKGFWECLNQKIRWKCHIFCWLMIP